ncbi:Peroxiredoxin-5, mitochondrial [Geodia barretti]|uniref:Peroxiredoxin-5 n=1 Tax=Geodia barretti TaxID=519541 RepID=A0AA35W224_GEOBA|nr:Peroxiredoxin-5, mitochondrial [Geodia barretti]
MQIATLLTLETVGDTLPSLEVQEGTPATTVNVKDLFASKKGILFGVPGAFTPGCTKTHLPGYVQDWEKLKAKGVEVVACVSVNDVFVMAAWERHVVLMAKVRMLADHNGAYTKALDLEFDAVGALGLYAANGSLQWWRTVSSKSSTWSQMVQA